MKLPRSFKWLMYLTILYILVSVFCLIKFPDIFDNAIFIIELVWVLLVAMPLYVKPVGVYVFETNKKVK